MPRFVLLAHDHPSPHFDLMLEAGTGLRTWRLDQQLTKQSSQRATPLADHRLAYLDYEGPVSGGRGSVQRVERGEFSILSEAADVLEVHLQGEQSQGRLRLSRDGEQWRCEWLPNPS